MRDSNVTSFVRNLLDRGLPIKNIEQLQTIENSELYFSFLNFSFLSDYIQTEKPNDIIIDQEKFFIFSKDKSQYGHEIPSDFFHLILENLCLIHNIKFNFTTPFVSFFSTINNYPVRVTLVHHQSFHQQSSKIYLRFQSKNIFPLKNFTDDPFIEMKLREFIINKKNILISGATSSGKTSLTNSLLENIPTHEHLIILEDTPEIQCHHKNYSHFLSQHRPQFQLNDYMSYALRMRPDRIIVGELRSEECASFLLALNSGHGGAISTIHANTALGAVEKLCLLFNLYRANPIEFKLVKKLISQSLDYIIQVEDHQIVQIIQLINCVDDKILFEEIYKKQGHIQDVA